MMRDSREWEGECKERSDDICKSKNISHENFTSLWSTKLNIISAKSNIKYYLGISDLSNGNNQQPVNEKCIFLI